MPTTTTIEKARQYYEDCEPGSGADDDAGDCAGREHGVEIVRGTEMGSGERRMRVMDGGYVAFEGCDIVLRLRLFVLPEGMGMGIAIV